MSAGGVALAQEPATQEKVAAFKQSLQESQAKLRKYEWVETTVFSLKGEEKARKQNRCYYGADGKVQKVAIDQPAEEQSERRGRRRGGRLKKKIVEKKKAEITAEMQRAAELLHMYVPPDPALIQKSKDAGKASVDKSQPGRLGLAFGDYLQPGDTLAVHLDPAANRLLGASVDTYLDEARDPVKLDIGFETLPDGASYPAAVDLVVASQKVHVNVSQSGHRPVQQ